MAEDTEGASAVEPTPLAIRRQLDAVVTSDGFARSARSRELLRYVVEEALAGRGARITATTIAQDVLGKDESFDSSSDPLVRVQMGRMRTLLDAWYEADGALAPVRISVPKGGYRPRFEGGADDPPPSEPTDAAPRTAPDDAPTAAGRGTGGVADRWRARLDAAEATRAHMRPGHLITGLLLAGLAVIALVSLTIRTATDGRGYPVVVVRPFANLTGVSANDSLSTGLQRQLASDLQRFRTVRVALDDGKSEEAPVPNGRMAAPRPATPRADYALTGAILSASDELDFTLDLIDLDNNELIERRRLRGDTTDDYYALLTELSQAATGRILGGGGAVERAELARFEDATAMPVEDGLDAFRCLIVFDEFTRVKTEEGARAAHDCLAALVAQYPSDSTLLSALAWTEALVAPDSGQLRVGSWADGFTLAEAMDLAERAVTIGPGNDFAHEHLALLQWRVGQKGAAIDSLRRASALNPGNPHLLADLALYFGFLGEWEASAEMAKAAFARSGNPPGWYWLPAYYRALLDGRGREATRLAGIVSEGDPYGPVYRLAAAVTAGDEDAVASLRGEVLEATRRMGGDPLRDARPWIRSDEVLGVLEDRLAEAGIVIEGS